MTNRVTGSLTPEELTAIKTTIQDLKGRIPFLEEFTPEEIAVMPKLGGRSLEFVQTALEGAEALADYLTKHFDLEEFARDVRTYQDLMTIRLALEPFWRQLDNTLIAVGSDALEAALEVYATLKRAPKGSGAEAYVDAMSKRWRRAKASATNGAEASSGATAAPTATTAGEAG